jgi:hypothetical protein
MLAVEPDKVDLWQYMGEREIFTVVGCWYKKSTSGYLVKMEVDRHWPTLLLTDPYEVESGAHDLHGCPGWLPTRSPQIVSLWVQQHLHQWHGLVKACVKQEVSIKWLRVWVTYAYTWTEENPVTIAIRTMHLVVVCQTIDTVVHQLGLF